MKNTTCNNLNANDAVTCTWKPKPQTMKFRAAFLVAVVLPFCLCMVVFRCCAAALLTLVLSKKIARYALEAMEIRPLFA